jgi:hypothetical protein
MARKVSRTSRRSRSPLAWVAVGCGATVVLGLIAIGVLYLLATAKPRPPREAAYSSAPAPADSAQPGPSGGGSEVSGGPSASAAPGAPAPDLETQLRYARAAGRSPQPVRVQLVINQGELNSYLAGHTRQGEVRDVSVYFGEGVIVASGLVNWRGRHAYLTLRGHPIVTGGDVDLIVDEVAVGRLPAPAALKRDAQRRLDSALDELIGRERFRAESVRVTPGTMVIEGSAGGGR